MRDPDLWSQISGEMPVSDAQLTAFAAKIGASVAATQRIADEVPRLRYLDAIAPYDAAPPLALLTLLQRPIPDLEDLDAVARYRDTRALYELEFGAPPPPEIWTDHPPAIVAKQLARHGNAVDGVLVQRERTSWFVTGPVLALTVAVLVVDITSDQIDMTVGLHLFLGAATLILLWGSLVPHRNPLIHRTADDDTIAERQRVGLYLWADQQLLARRIAGEEGEADWDDDGDGDGGGDGGGD